MSNHEPQPSHSDSMSDSVQKHKDFLFPAVTMLYQQPIALERGEGGALIGPSAYYCKHPPQQFNDDTAGQMVEEYIADAALAAE